MKIYNCKQNTDEWEEIKKGKITASTFGNLITPTLSIAKSITAKETICEILHFHNIHTSQLFSGPFIIDLDRFSKNSFILAITREGKRSNVDANLDINTFNCTLGMV